MSIHENGTNYKSKNDYAKTAKGKWPRNTHAEEFEGPCVTLTVVHITQSVLVEMVQFLE